jgi:succinate dehydrogenase/fumarate reductase cytochrome b subunit
LTHLNVPAIVFGGLAGISAVATVYFVVETVLLLTGQQPITWYVRNLTSWHPGVAVLVVALLAFGLGAGISHFVWDAARNALVAHLR